MAFNIGKRTAHNAQAGNLEYLVELKTGTKEQSSFVAPTSVDFIADIAGSNSACTVRLACGLALRTNQSAAELVTELQPFCTMLAISTGWVNLAAVVAITQNGSATMLRLKGGSGVSISSEMIAELDAAMARARGVSAKAAA